MATRVGSISPLTLTEYKALVAGIPTYAPNATFMVAGQTFTATQAVTFIENVLNAVVATATAKGNWKDAIAAEEKIVAQNGATVREIRTVLGSMFSNAQNTLAAFEITPRKPYVPLSAEKRAAATAKAKATRLARGTTSKKKKAAVTGNVTGVTITPTTASEAAVTAPTAATSSVAAPSAPSAAVAPAASGAVASEPAVVPAPVVTVPAGVAVK